MHKVFSAWMVFKKQQTSQDLHSNGSSELGFLRLCQCTPGLMHLTQKKSREQLCVCTYFLVTMEITWKVNWKPWGLHFGKQVAQTVFWSGAVSLPLKPGVISTSKRGVPAGWTEQREAPSWPETGSDFWTLQPAGCRTFLDGLQSYHPSCIAPEEPLTRGWSATRSSAAQLPDCHCISARASQLWHCSNQEDCKYIASIHQHEQ